MKQTILVLALVIIGCTKSTEEPQPLSFTVEGITFEMMPIHNQDSFFYISKTEVSWDLYDIFLQFINSPENQYAGVDAITGPTPAYATVDRGFGRNGYPAISMSAQAAEAFCNWLTIRTGFSFTLPKIEQWKICNTEGGNAWHKWNSGGTTHPIASTAPNSLGLYDMRGNVGEWVITTNGPRVIGGSFRTPAEELGVLSLLVRDKTWNQTDPQLPRSPWWLADADYVGLRLVLNEGKNNE